MIQLFNDEWMKDLMIERLYEWMNELYDGRRCICTSRIAGNLWPLNEWMI
jgi:hypothetical protein